MQDINRRLEADTAKLKKNKELEDNKIEGEREEVDKMRRRNMDARKQLRTQKKECQVEKDDALNK